jgi:hypothetical protein
MAEPTSFTSGVSKNNNPGSNPTTNLNASADALPEPIPMRPARTAAPVGAPSSNEVAAAILLQTVIDHHPHLQAEIREQQPEPEAVAHMLVPFYKAMLEKMNQ